ncbi:MAG: site-2 protease family protein [Ignavibacterium sp.]|nr:site-2 protease family protein [Ignavibacterium sp.]MCX7612095.1 site-2 protease family protein [Ignavibacterium sp.]MDW8375835.1 site-2 protease family protein [Ignavibacteriales bacterium]
MDTKKIFNYLIHIILFLLTFITTTIAGVEWTTGLFPPYEFSTLAKGLPYSLSILTIITFHEFGHYFAAKYHKIKSTLPFYIPLPPIQYFLNFGTMGAVIKTKSPVNSNKIMFDIGVAGPIAGFIATLGILIYGFLNVPPVQYILEIHPDYFSPEYGKDGLQLVFGDSILFILLREIFVKPDTFFPPMSEIYHYPYLCAGWFGLLITSMNMIPVGQLDGGHISYSMFGEKKHYAISSISFIFLFAVGIVGILDSTFGFNLGIGWSGWFFWAMILYFIVRLKHPPIPYHYELNAFRKFLGWLSFLIFILSFSPEPIIIANVIN